MMKAVKARLVLLGVRQNAMARDLGMEVIRLNKILNGWLQPTSDETQKIKSYLQNRRCDPSSTRKDAAR
jgi:hypothetical protein